jgi:cobalamin biosynthesis Mg chelatase CobN
MNTQIAKLERSLSELKSRKDQVATEATLLEARAKAADASIAINATIQGVGDNNFGEMMDIARKKADEKEARANALNETSVSAGDDLKAKIMGTAANGADTRVNDRLAKMKADAERKKQEKEAEEQRKRFEVNVSMPSSSEMVSSQPSQSSSHNSGSHDSGSSCHSCSSSSSDSGSCSSCD